MTPIAVVGLACRMPGAPNARALARLLDEGRDAVVPIPDSRWPAAAVASLPAGVVRPRHAGLLEDVAGFDAEFFGIAAAEALAMDPQQRLLLEVTHDALADAGVPTRALAGSATSVFVGLSSADYTERLFADVGHVGPFTTTGGALSVIANRISYTFDLRGPSVVVDTACSSSLLAVLLAMRSLASGESTLAVAAGVNVILSPAVYAGFAMAQALSPDGRCRAFDAGANGMVRGEGVGVVVLKPLARALADGDRIHAVLRGGATNQDGRTNGLAAPSRFGQEALLRAAYADAGVEPRAVKYVEAHGTGTPLGDPIEALALGAVVGGGERSAPCRLGSIKTNVGHLEGAAGIAGLLKTVLSLEAGVLYPSLHFEQPNPRIPFGALGLEVVRRRTIWDGAGPRLAGVSAFGFGGTNVHLVVEEAPARAAPPVPREGAPLLLPLSARSEPALAELAARARADLPAEDELAALVRGAIVRRDVEPVRAWASFSDRDELARELERIAASGGARAHATPRVAFVFPGMGAQQGGMGRALLDEPAFAAAIDACDAALAPECGFSVREAIASGAASDRGDRVQPVLFAYQVAFARLLEAWGAAPALVIGASVGEVAAAHVSGALSLEDAARVVVRRARLLMTREGHGRLAIAEIDERECEALLGRHRDRVFVAAEYAPRLRLLAGETAALEQVFAELEAKGRLARFVKGGVVGSHSPFVEPLRAPLEDALAGIAPVAPRVPMLSTVTGGAVAGERLDAAYWWRNVREPIRFERAARAALDAGADVFVEIAPQPTMTGALREILATGAGEDARIIALARGSDRSERLAARDVAGALFAAGAIDAAALAPAGSEFVPLPPHPFRHESFLLGAPNARSLVVPAPAGATRDEARAPAAAPARDRASIVEHLRAHVAHALRRAPSEIDATAPLTHLGVGSLMGMDLHAKLRREFGVSLPTVTFLRGPSIERIADLLLETMTSAREEAIHPLSRAQEQLAFVHALAPDSPAYAIPVALRLSGRLDAAALEQALQRIVERHDVLRATVRSAEATMLVGPVPRAVLERADVAPADLERVLGERARAPFDLARGPLFRAALLRVGPEEHVLFASMHHVVGDGFSLGILLDELARAYRAFARGEEPDLPPLAARFGELAAIERATPLPDDDLEWFARSLAGASFALPLPFDRPAPERARFSGARITARLAPALTDALERFARAEGATPFAVTYAAFSVWLARFGQPDVVVGAPFVDRSAAGSEHLIGPFLRTLPLRLVVDEARSFRDAVHAAREVVLGALAHPNVSFDALAKRVRPARGATHAPLVHVTLAYHAPVTLPELPGLSLARVPLDTGTAKYDLAASFLPEDDGLTFELEFDRDRFDDETGRELVRGFLFALESLLGDADAPMHALPAAPSAPRASTPSPPPAPTALAATLAYCTRSADHAAVVDGDASLSYGELARNARAFARALHAHGVSAGDVVALWAAPGPRAIAAALGAWLAGAAYFPLDPALPRLRAEEAARTANAKLLADDAELTRLEAEGARIRDGEPALVTAAAADALAYVILTSGTSGRPKCVGVTHGALGNLLAWHHERYGTSERDRTTLVANPGFDAAVWEIWSALAAGATLVVVPSEVRDAPTRLGAWLERSAVTQTFLPTPLFETVSDDVMRVTTLREVLVGGDRLLQRPAKQARARLTNHYGPTECAVVATCATVDADGSGSPPIGDAIPGVRAYVVDAYGREAPRGGVGELWLAGASLAIGYLGDDALTRERFVAAPRLGEARAYRTGDRVRALRSGALEFLGRIDDQVKVRGQRVEPLELERVLARHEGVREVAVTVVGAPADPRLSAYVVAAPGVREEALAQFVAERLPSALHPAAIVLLSALPRTDRGKIDRAALPAPMPRAREGAAPADDVERAVAALYGELLGVSDVRRDDDFFALGGHSLLAMRLAAKVHDAFGVHLPLPAILGAPSVAQLASAIVQARRAAGAPSAAAGASFPLTEVQEAYWIGRRDDVSLGGVAAQAYVEIDVPASLDLAQLEHALDRLVARHDMLRAIVQSDGTQRILASVPSVQVPRIDLRDLAPAARAARLDELRRRLSHERLPADRAPMLAVRATLLDGETTRLHATIDGLVADARSVATLVGELAVLLARPDARLAPLGFTFREYVLAMRTPAREAARERALAYWRERIATLPDPPALPVVAPRGPDVFRRRACELEPAVWAALKKRASARGLTPTTILVTAFAESLARWAERSSFTISVTRFAREPIHPDVDRIVGDFTELALLEASGLGARSFVDAAKALQARWWADLEHRAVSAVGVLRELARARGERIEVPVAFTSLLDGQAPEAPFGKTVHAITQTPQVLLDHQTAERGGALVVQWDARDARFAPGVLDGMFALYERALRALADDDGAWDAPGGPAAIRAPAPAAATALEASSETLLDGFVRSAAERPDDVALVTPDARLRYGEVERLAGALAARLRARGAGPGQRVAFVVRKGWEGVVAALAIVATGAAYVPFEIELEGAPPRIAARERLATALARAECGVIVTTPDLAPLLPLEAAAAVITVDASLHADAQPLATTRVPADAPAYVMFTSGSTGVPKGVVLPHAAAVSTIRDIRARFGVARTDRALQLSSLGFDLSVFDVFGVLGAGGALVVPHAREARDPAHAFALVARERVTVWNSVPTLLSMLLAYADSRSHEEALGSLRIVLSSGDFMPLGLPAALRKHAPRATLASLGGATEAGIWSVVHVVGDVAPDWTSIPYGAPLAGQSMTVLDEALRERPPHAVGDLFIGGSGLALGYLGDAALTAARFVRHPETGERLYRTGDRGRRWSDGTLEILGREDDQVKIGGERIELGEIEAAIARHPAVREVSVVAPGARESRRLVAHVVPRGPLTEAELAAFADEHLPRSYRPRRWVLAESLPLGPTGKIDRKRLVARSTASPTSAEPALSADGADDGDAVAARVRELVVEVLALPSIATDADLLASGADSLQLVRLGNRLEETFGHRPAMQELYALRTIDALARHYRERGAVPRATSTPRGARLLAAREERDAFKREQRGVRRFDEEARALALPAGDALPTVLLERRSARSFGAGVVAFDALADLLAAAAVRRDGATARRLYPSAGALYPVQLYVHVRAGAVRGVDGGAYYHHPEKHALVPLAPGAMIPARAHSFDNARLFAGAAFSLFLVSDLDAIEPIYGELARDFSLLEAGALTQLLMTSASPHGLALCPIGTMDASAVAPMLRLGPRHVVVHSLLGGLVDKARVLTDTPRADVEYEVVTI